jgi:hypothetical protein
LENPFGFLDTIKDQAEETEDDEEEDGQPKSKVQMML